MKRFSLFILFALLLAACSPASSTPAVAPAGEAQKPAAAEPLLTEAPPAPAEALPPAWDGPLPILTASNQGQTFGPGQAIGAFGRGFEPGEDVAVAIIHETEGILANQSARADALGNAQTAHLLKQTAGEPGGLPAGRYELQMAGTLQTLSFGFCLSIDKESPMQQKLCPKSRN